MRRGTGYRGIKDNLVYPVAACQTVERQGLATGRWPDRDAVSDGSRLSLVQTGAGFQGVVRIHRIGDQQARPYSAETSRVSKNWTRSAWMGRQTRRKQTLR